MLRHAAIVRVNVDGDPFEGCFPPPVRASLEVEAAKERVDCVDGFIRRKALWPVVARTFGIVRVEWPIASQALADNPSEAVVVGDCLAVVLAGPGSWDGWEWHPSDLLALVCVPPFEPRFTRFIECTGVGRWVLASYARQCPEPVVRALSKVTKEERDRRRSQANDLQVGLLRVSSSWGRHERSLASPSRRQLREDAFNVFRFMDLSLDDIMAIRLGLIRQSVSQENALSIVEIGQLDEAACSALGGRPSAIGLDHGTYSANRCFQCLHQVD
jgi:hypothetical protein